MTGVLQVPNSSTSYRDANDGTGVFATVGVRAGVFVGTGVGVGAVAWVGDGVSVGTVVCVVPQATTSNDTSNATMIWANIMPPSVIE